MALWDFARNYARAGADRTSRTVNPCRMMCMCDAPAPRIFSARIFQSMCVEKWASIGSHVCVCARMCVSVCLWHQYAKCTTVLATMRPIERIVVYNLRCALIKCARWPRLWRCVCVCVCVFTREYFHTKDLHHKTWFKNRWIACAFEYMWVFSTES